MRKNGVSNNRVCSLQKYWFLCILVFALILLLRVKFFQLIQFWKYILLLPSKSTPSSPQTNHKFQLGGLINNSNSSRKSISTQNYKCYEWNSQKQSFTPRLIKPNTPIFDPKHGLLPGEDGGKHVKCNTTIYPNPQLPEQRTYTASEGQDLLVLEILDYKRNGIFVDVGARYWHKGSNSFALEYYYGWEGICIEPDSHFYVGLAINRTCTVICNNAIDSVDSKRIFFNYQVGSNQRHIPGNDFETKYTVSLGRVFHDFHLPASIDYLSLDIEGYEFNAIKTLNFSNYKFFTISVERPTFAFHDLMSRYGYWWLTHLPGNFGENMYIHESIPTFEKMMNKYRPFAQSTWRQMSASYLLKPQWNSTEYLRKRRIT